MNATIEAIAKTAGVYHFANLVMKRSVGDFRAAAFCTISSILEMVESSKGPAASIVRSPSRARVPPCTGSPWITWTGIDSPVIEDESISEAPDLIMPSIGIISPGRTCIMSPFTISFGSTTISAPSFITLAESGLVASSAFIERLDPEEALS